MCGHCECMDWWINQTMFNHISHNNLIYSHFFFLFRDWSLITFEGGLLFTKKLCKKITNPPTWFGNLWHPLHQFFSVPPIIVTFMCFIRMRILGRLKICTFLKSYAPQVKSCSFWSKKPQKKISWNFDVFWGCPKAPQICRFQWKIGFFGEFRFGEHQHSHSFSFTIHVLSCLYGM